MSGRLFFCMETALNLHTFCRVSLYTTNRSLSKQPARKQSRVRIANKKTATKKNLDIMADQAPKEVEEKKDKEIVGEEKRLDSPAVSNPPPSPPEKPLPGDCCGNGCVPCVWDTYYEELEEYNKLCKSNDAGHKPKS